ncbi:CENP-A-nucleosome distal centromere subunit CENP-L [Penicillium hispanicum]|uniref:CENP-A-nucleosome distal centromere subunit CENP-L n=1 Tax=Penicillium hispanicum TaxID=1080232 RepID=UPI002541C9A8|nr:CENP-A-nucleosome distal centromere subunit CENP-L [Penicillium hispanicum]KAJ5574071.1 CENP-A-nucleosome distal centromere subunit CENP-L [Penicillium hispanicum]
MEQASQDQLFNTSWTLHRLSPLYHAKDCETLLDNSAALKVYAMRLRDQLTGDVLAGLHVSAATADDNALSKTGALKDCSWQAISAWSPRRDEGQRPRATATSFPGILVTLEYENITYKAALLTDTEPRSRGDSQRVGSTYLPLLLTKFPNALRQTFISFLSANFDTYCSTLRLPSNFLCTGLELFVHELRHARGSSARSAANDTVEDVIKELQLTLAFSPSIAPALRTLNVSISRDALVDFSRDKSAVSKARAVDDKPRNPVIRNMASYLENHLAMKLDLDGSSQNQVARQHVRLSKVACAAFVLGSEGRMKLVVAGQSTDDEELSVRHQSALHASEALLRTVIYRAVIGDQAT